MEENRSDQQQEPLEPAPVGDPSLETLPEESQTAEPVRQDEVIVLKKSHVLTALVPLAFVLGLAMGYTFWGRNQSAASVTTAPIAGQSLSQPSQQRFEVSAEGAPSLGPDDAAVTIIEFSDFNCPYCRAFHETTFQDLLEAYPDQIRFVYRDFPILGQESFVAAQASHCANEQGAYWEFHDALFSGAQALGRSAYETYAADLNLDVEALLSCLDDGRYAPLVNEGAQYAAGLGVTGTPTFFINGIPLVGNQPLQQFQQIIDGELN